MPDLITKKPCRALFLLIFFSWLETKLKWTVRKSIRIGNTKKTVLILWFTARDKMYIWKESSPEVKHTLRIPIINLRHNTYNWNVLSYIWMFWEIFYRQVFSPCEHNVPALILINMIGLETSLIRSSSCTTQRTFSPTQKVWEKSFRSQMKAFNTFG